MSEVPLGEAAELLGVNRRTLSRARRAGCPGFRPEGKEVLVDVDLVRAWRAGRSIQPTQQATRRAALPPAQAPPASPPPRGHRPPSPVELGAELEQAALALRNPDATPVDRARAALVGASNGLAAALEEGGGGPKDYEAFAGALHALRMAEKAYMELDRERGELVPVGVATALMGALARRLVLAGESLQVAMADQVEVWLEDQSLRALDQGDRGRQVRAWVGEVVHELRLGESSEEVRAELERQVVEALEFSR